MMIGGNGQHGAADQWYPYGLRSYAPPSHEHQINHQQRFEYAAQDEFDMPQPIMIPARQPPVSYYSEDTFRRYLAKGVGLASWVAENLVSHPFIVLRRQCQVHYNSQKFHLVPVSLVPVVVCLHRHQGLTSLWKGLGSVLLIRGMMLGIEDVISKFTLWPKDIDFESSWRGILHHTYLKCISLAIVTPYYAASLVETVQSDIASETPGVFDVFREGTIRLLSWGGGPTGRMLPYWALVLPTVGLGVTKYLFTFVLRQSTERVALIQARCDMERHGALPRDTVTNASHDIELYAGTFALITADVLFYPFETILHRLHLQGTRTIIDNLDNGESVIPILSNYGGLADCYRSCLRKEGNRGFYKGFGALIMQYTVHVAIIYMAKGLVAQVGVKSAKKASSPPQMSRVEPDLYRHLP